MSTKIELFDELSALLRSNAHGMHTAKDEPGNLYLEWREPDAKGKRRFFGAVQAKKSYVAFHLMPLYEQTELLNSLSSALKKRMQGKSCFNFKKRDDALFDELNKIVRQVS